MKVTSILESKKGGKFLMRDEIKPEDVQKLRKKFNENQNKFAKRFGVSQQAVSLWESGRNKLRGPAAKLFKLYAEISDKV